MLRKLLAAYGRAKRVTKIGRDLMKGGKPAPKISGSKLRRGPVHLRRKLGSINPQSIARRPYSGKISITPGITDWQLRRKIIVHAVKKYTGHKLAIYRGNRQEAAASLRRERQQSRNLQTTNARRASAVRSAIPQYAKRAAKVIAKIK
jgi:hypothetical protein